MMQTREKIRQSFNAAFPIMLGYIGIGIPCGILSASIGLNMVQVLLLSVFFYSGAGQFMIPNMWLAGAALPSIIASVSLVNTRQILYSTHLAQFCQTAKKRLAFLFSATVTDESYAVNVARFSEGGWSVGRATMVNLFSQSSWVISNVVGVAIGSAIDIPLPIAAFAMTSIFICLLCMQKLSAANVVAVVAAVVGVVICKFIGLNEPAIFIGAVTGVVTAFAFSKVRRS